MPTLAMSQQQADAVAAVGDFSTKLLTILKGPVTKIVGAIILLAGTGGLLQGRHRMAICCGAAFLILLFLPMLLEKVGN